MDDIQAHLAVHSQKWFFAYHLSSKTISILIYRGYVEDTHSGNLPLHLATYSLRTVPAMNSEETCRARSCVRGMIMMPDVNLSSLLTAVSRVSVRLDIAPEILRRTIGFLVSKLIFKDFNESITVIPA